MKKIINFLLVLAFGAVLGYVFHNTIDVKLKTKFGEVKVEAGKTVVENSTEKVIELGEAIIDTVKTKSAENKTK